MVACDSGGPLETVGIETGGSQRGFLCRPVPNAFSNAMLALARDVALVRRLGSNGRQHVKAQFSFQGLSRHLNSAVTALVPPANASRFGRWRWSRVGPLLALVLLFAYVFMAILCKLL